MTTTTQTYTEVAGNNEIHLIKNFDPTQYEWIDSVDLQPEPGSFLPERDGQGKLTGYVGPIHGGFNPYHEHYLHCKALLASSSTSIFNKGERGSQCDTCGAHVRYTCIVLHKPTNTYMAMGEVCINKLSISGKGEFQSRYIRSYAENMRVHNKKMEARAKFLADHAGLEDALKFDHRIVQDINAKLTQWGSISDRQIELVNKIIRESTQQAAVKAAREQEVFDDAPEGRMVVEGQIVSIKTLEGQYGASTKMLVVASTPKKFKIWTTLPAQIAANAEKGDKITFTVTVTPSKDDRKFAWGNRPTKAKIVPMAPETLTDRLLDMVGAA